MKRITIAIIILLLMFGSGAAINNFKGSDAQFETTLNSHLNSQQDLIVPVIENEIAIENETVVEAEIAEQEIAGQLAMNELAVEEPAVEELAVDELAVDEIVIDDKNSIEYQLEKEKRKQEKLKQQLAENKQPAVSEKEAETLINPALNPKQQIDSVELTANQQLANQRKALDLAPPIPPGTLGGGNGNGGPGAGQQTASSN
ncbi:hypothetical protein [Thalassotalea crassostreae]|uniref:hypothetical protein n=1 Tax=Thalassotalea crassostreae TaxID=1763536 RepID=UPI0008399298|nr:hypothetical protein [Thalassotalea crassostreae]